MTWHADQTEGRPQGDAKDMLIIERSILVNKVIALSATAIGKSNAAKVGRQEDLLAIAKQIKAIDKKLGRL